MSEVWAAIDEETGLVTGMASMKVYTFSQAVKEFGPREVRRMESDEAVESGMRYNDLKFGGIPVEEGA